MDFFQEKQKQTQKEKSTPKYQSGEVRQVDLLNGRFILIYVTRRNRLQDSALEMLLRIGVSADMGTRGLVMRR